MLKAESAEMHRSTITSKLKSHEIFQCLPASFARFTETINPTIFSRGGPILWNLSRRWTNISQGVIYEWRES